MASNRMVRPGLWAVTICSIRIMKRTTMTKRLDCIELINQMPESGLDECLSTIKEMFDFYCEDAMVLVLPITIENTLIGRILESVVRPPLVIPYD